MGTKVMAGRTDWDDLKGQIDLVSVATNLLGPPPGRPGERSRRRRYWHCPFHEDKNPSFCIEPGKLWFKCWGCSEHGDAATLVMRLEGVAFPEAVRWLAEHVGVAPSSGRPRAPSGGKPARSAPSRDPAPGKATASSPDTPSGLPLADALQLVEDSQKGLWLPEGRPALDYLRNRGLTDDTIRLAGLGWTPGVLIPTRDGTRHWPVTGIVIPWMEHDRLTMVNIRRPDGESPKYAMAYRNRPSIYSIGEAIHPARPLVVTEGELDCCLLIQSLVNLAAVVTLGSASMRPEGAIYLAMLPAPVWYLAHDADEAGDKAAAGWPARAIRVRPPAGKDWTDARRAGIDLRRWWVEMYFPAEFDREDREERAAIMEFDREERAAIMEFDGGLTREAAERAAGVSRGQS